MKKIFNGLYLIFISITLPLVFIIFLLNGEVLFGSQKLNINTEPNLFLGGIIVWLVLLLFWFFVVYIEISSFIDRKVK